MKNIPREDGVYDATLAYFWLCSLQESFRKDGYSLVLKNKEGEEIVFNP